MRRDRVLLTVILAVTFLALAIVIAGILSWLPGNRADRQHITEAEHDRLLATCLAATESRVAKEGCPEVVAAIVQRANERDCGYRGAAHVLATILSGDKAELEALFAGSEGCLA